MQRQTRRHGLTGAERPTPAPSRLPTGCAKGGVPVSAPGCARRGTTAPARPPRGLPGSFGMGVCAAGPLRGRRRPVRAVRPRPFARQARSVSGSCRHGGPAPSPALRRAGLAHGLPGRCAPYARAPGPPLCGASALPLVSATGFALRGWPCAAWRPHRALAPAHPPIRPPRGLPLLSWKSRVITTSPVQQQGAGDLDGPVGLPHGHTLGTGLGRAGFPPDVPGLCGACRRWRA